MLGRQRQADLYRFKDRWSSDLQYNSRTANADREILSQKNQQTNHHHPPTKKKKATMKTQNVKEI